MYDDIIHRWKIANPIRCQGLGLHEFDSEVPDFTTSHIEDRIKELQQDIASVEKLPNPENRIEFMEKQLVLAALKLEHFELSERREYQVSAIPYVAGWHNTLNMIQKSHTQRSYAPIEERVRSIIELECKFPEFLATATYNLKNQQLSAATTQMCLNYVSGYISYYEDELIEFIMKADDDNLIDEWSKVNEKAIAGLKLFHQFLTNKLESAHSQFKIGEEKFLALLKYTEGVEISVEKLLEVGYSDLESNYNAMVKIAVSRGQTVSELIDEMQSDYPDPNKMLDYTRLSADRAREFVLSSNLVHVPNKSQCEVIYTPKSDRKFEFASMNTPGPFEVPEAAEAFYRVNPPDMSWSEDRIDQYMRFFNKSFFESVTVHEAWPGHYLQLLYQQRSKSEIAKMFAKAITMIEGWAHYCEEMIYEHGYEPFDRDLYHAGQLFGALIRNVRYISAVEMHCRDKTVEESKKMFMEKAFMPEPNAEIEANRGTIDPMYLNYTLGKLLIKKLLKDYRREQGDNFDLITFHDTLLSYGSAPISILRSVLLENPGEDIL